MLHVFLPILPDSELLQIVHQVVEVTLWNFQEVKSKSNCFLSFGFVSVALCSFTFYLFCRWYVSCPKVLPSEYVIPSSTDIAISLAGIVLTFTSSVTFTFSCHWGNILLTYEWMIMWDMKVIGDYSCQNCSPSIPL